MPSSSNAIEVVLRRLYVYELYTRELTVPEIKQMAADRFDCATRTIARDLNSMDTWIESIIGIRDKAEESRLQAVDTAAKMKVALKGLLNLGETAVGSPAARVGAYRSFIDGNLKLADFMSRTGLMKMDAPTINVKGETRHKWTLTEALGDYGDIIMEAIQTDIEFTDRKQTRQNSEQPMVPEEEPERQ